jgi:hypothetical protein
MMNTKVNGTQAQIFPYPARKKELLIKPKNAGTF